MYFAIVSTKILRTLYSNESYFIFQIIRLPSVFWFLKVTWFYDRDKVLKWNISTL